MKTQSSFAIARNWYKDRLQDVLPTSFITPLSPWLIESAMIPYNATSSNPTRDNRDKRDCKLHQRIMLVRDKAYYRRTDYTVDLPDSKTADTGCSFSKFETRKPCDSAPKLELNKDELARMFVSVKLELMAKSARVEAVETKLGATVGSRRKPLGSYFKSIESCLSQVIFHQRFLDAYCVAGSYEMILDKRITRPDPKSMNVDLFRDMTWLLGKDTVNLIFEAFATSEGRLDGMVTIELKSGGADVSATEENNEENIETVIECHAKRRAHEEFNRDPELLIGGTSDMRVKDRLEPELIERSSRSKHSVVTGSTVVVRKGEHMKQDDSPDSSFTTKREEE
ncbi:hypothetical protein BS47DRAFT_1391988 [Hydnum rufescens UP504]|uniref:HECT-type E3 ubiquitin transferase n=1 Tax=Hydnum rufescens UP504 TaxID=1448309 RepID=A0A9P6B080_9AGAM|nr:hypothetical protein BS47DRAFT_1391988 [Hydnum rufescens UP504]